MTSEQIEAFAIRCALGNNGGTWAEHYTEGQKEHWRRFVRDLVSDAVKAEQDRCCQIVYGQCNSDVAAERTVRAMPQSGAIDMATIFDGMDRDQVMAEALRYRELAARNGSRCFSLTTAIKLARQFGMDSSDFVPEVSSTLSRWIDSGMQEAAPWPSSPCVQQWLMDQGYSDCHGKIGIRATMTLALSLPEAPKE